MDYEDVTCYHGCETLSVNYFKFGTGIEEEYRVDSSNSWPLQVGSSLARYTRT